MWLVDPGTWDDEKFSQLAPVGKLSWLCLLTGPFRTALPGLICAFSPLILADTVRVPQSEAIYAMTSMIDLGLVEYDSGTRVLRIPRAPRFAICRNPNMLAGWFRLWGNVTECSLKYAHIASIAESVNFSNEKMLERWNRTFGRVEHQLSARSDADRIPRMRLLDKAFDTLNHSEVLDSKRPALPEPAKPPVSARSRGRGRPPSPTRADRPDPSRDSKLPVTCLIPAKRKQV